MSTSVTFNNALTMTFPEGFHVMDASERKEINILGDGPSEILTDPDRHIIVSIGWKPLPLLSSMLLGAKDGAKNTKAAISKAMDPYGFHANETLKKSLGSDTAEGFSYDYTAQGISMYGESYVVKHNKTFYYLYLYARAERKEESLRVWDEILASAEWA